MMLFRRTVTNREVFTRLTTTRAFGIASICGVRTDMSGGCFAKVKMLKCVRGNTGRPILGGIGQAHNGIGCGIAIRNCDVFGRKICQQRLFSSYRNSAEQSAKNLNVLLYMMSIVIAGVGIAYAAVPLYKVFCQVTGFGGTTQQVTMEQAKKMVPVPGAAPITVEFVCNTSDSLPWEFKAQQREVCVVPGETALAFYTARNKSDKPITGVATYNITPAKAGIYFNKIQCFCFDQQRLRPNEEVDMPVFFYVDPTFADDPQMRGIDNIVLSYTFFKAK
uniref:Cytochrome c oxidase assembly protein COX11, mitochondrial n=1 Tax=Mucochytrium quahogii TaxID=96639 RepID=A0A7S2WBI7_9STRA|mmetsp:Transcript_4894/g.7403  ORF Transcript_4894/g.7403 Transcript_4894/m.7403 type:complete len:277 (+) Transcript_4894:620-1450(+)